VTTVAHSRDDQRETRGSRTPTAAQRRWLLWLEQRIESDERARQAEIRGYRRGVADTDPDAADTSRAVREAFAAGMRAAATSGSDWQAGWDACLDRFAELIGGRIMPRYPTPAEVRRWTRHHPDCHVAANGRRPCKRLGCIPGPRADFAKPAPWDRAGTS